MLLLSCTVLQDHVSKTNRGGKKSAGSGSPLEKNLRSWFEKHAYEPPKENPEIT